jgi:hypothetical protein
VDETFGGSIPRQFLPAIEKGVRQKMAEGVVAGHDARHATSCRVRADSSTASTARRSVRTRVAGMSERRRMSALGARTA